MKNSTNSWMRLSATIIWNTCGKAGYGSSAGGAPYPLQNNIRYLPEDALLECLIGLYRISIRLRGGSGNFKEWITESFGDGIAKYFMFPYNWKVWSTPLEKMSKDWIADRVSVVDFERVLSNVVLQRDDVSWGTQQHVQIPRPGRHRGDLQEDRWPVFRSDFLRQGTRTGRRRGQNDPLQ